MVGDLLLATHDFDEVVSRHWVEYTSVAFYEDGRSVVLNKPLNCPLVAS